MTESPRCAIYARFSSERQNSLSIDQQIRKCREHAERAGLCVLDEFIFADRVEDVLQAVVPGLIMAPALAA